MGIRAILSNPSAYHHIRNLVTGGLPLQQWAELAGLHDPQERVADLGCGPSDLLRCVSPERHPDFYLGIDISQAYLDAAQRLAASSEVNADFQVIDLERIPTDASVRKTLSDLLQKHRITRVLLFGVIHHLDDASALTTLNLIHDMPGVKCMVTQDVTRIPGHWMNNRYCDMDRGGFIRTEPEYDTLMAKTSWPHRQVTWTSPGFSFVKYIHFHLSK